MAVFICECCGETLKKQQIDRHCYKCRMANAFTCVECGTTFEGMSYKEHNQCMTEVEKFQGKFLERQRQAKEHAKKEQKIAKALKEKEPKNEVEEEKPEKEEAVEEEDGLTEKEKINLRKFLEDGCEFRGLETTVISVLKKQGTQQMKLKRLAKQITQIYKLSEDFDSDSDASQDEDGWLANRKKVVKRLKKMECSKLEIEGKVVKLVIAK